MSAANITALVGALAALVTAIGGVIAVMRHVNGPAHADPPPVPPEAPVTVVRPGASEPVPPLMPETPATPQKM